ncbi:4'-phosphopantetheinyl transferase [Allocatelliglobosispora scoriae]|uniref:4'-phosphopantetheinyl transferase n=1 Tax=Allocatelliglobosispora scoriae TaxID=643052 RepID=A0A841C152_9ACTN|nr:4'-phosphopantetheinyl transferase superfamily protein [Allocatelliglobosispora scoriae]MBB5873468.1 4'-phosphopantetheinyl transferase [Allocatelliglobosispora scoriae]
MNSPLTTEQSGQSGGARLACQVWTASAGAARSAHLALLDEVELERRARYRRDEDRDRFTVAAALLRLVVAGETGLDPAAVRVDRTCPGCAAQHGKPQIAGGAVHVSVSHSGDAVVLAVTRAAPIGVDVEVVGDRDVTGLARTVLGAAEPMRRDADFYTYWCRKEAIVKATGDGLRVPLIEVVVSAADEPARLVAYRGAPLAATLRDLSIDGGYAASVAILAEGELDVEMQDASGILTTLDR